MGRQSLAFPPGTSIHVIQRGNGSLPVFRAAPDYEVFLALLQRSITDRADIHAFVVMSTHFHLIVTPDSPAALGEMMHELDRRYSWYFNRSYRRTGTLWAGPYRRFPIETDDYWLMCLRYIEQNPVRARMVAAPHEYRWSSYAWHAFGTGPDWLTTHHLYQALGQTPEKRQEAYRALCGAPLSEEQVVLVRQGLLGGKFTRGKFTLLDDSNKVETIGVPGPY